jgi:hypothetical protein
MTQASRRSSLRSQGFYAACGRTALLQKLGRDWSHELACHLVIACWDRRFAMSRYLANVFLGRTQKYLQQLKAELKKTLKGHMSETWKKPCYHTPYAWIFDGLCISRKHGEEFFTEGSFSGPLKHFIFP